MRPFRSCAALLLTALAASPALAAPENSALAPGAIDATGGAAIALRETASEPYWAASLVGPSRDLPIPASAALDTAPLFRALLLGRDVRSERAGQGDLVGLLPILREQQRAEIFELRGDRRDAREVVDLPGGARIGMR